jgi:hypothetical protein
MSVAQACRLDLGWRLSWTIGALAVLASALGLFMPSIYRETAWVLPQNRGQDLVTLLAVAVLLPVLPHARRGSPRATLIAFGLLGYLAYTYTGAAFAYGFNALFLVYVALFALCGAALIAGLSGIDPAALHAAFDAGTPRRAVATFLLLMGAMLCLMWLGQIVPYFFSGALPPMIEKAKTPTVFVFVLDLGVVVPLALLSAVWLWRGRAWGTVLAAFVLVKAMTMGLALLSMTVFSWRAGIEVEPMLAAAWALLASAGGAMAFWFFAHCAAAERVEARARPWR